MRSLVGCRMVPPGAWSRGSKWVPKKTETSNLGHLDHLGDATRATLVKTGQLWSKQGNSGQNRATLVKRDGFFFSLRLLIPAVNVLQGREPLQSSWVSKSFKSVDRCARPTPGQLPKQILCARSLEPGIRWFRHSVKQPRPQSVRPATYHLWPDARAAYPLGAGARHTLR